MHHLIFVNRCTLYTQAAHAHGICFALISCSTRWQHWPSRCFTVKRKIKRWNNNNKIVETATTTDGIFIGHNFWRKERAYTGQNMKLSRAHVLPTCVCAHCQMEYTLKGCTFDCTHTLARVKKIKYILWSLDYLCAEYVLLSKK